MEGTTVGHLVKPPSPSQTTWHRIVSRQLLNIFHEENSEPYWTNCSSAWSVHNKEVLCHILVEFPVHHFLPVASCLITQHYLFIDTDEVSSQLSVLKTEQDELSQPFLFREMLTPLILFCPPLFPVMIWYTSMSSFLLVSVGHGDLFCLVNPFMEDFFLVFDHLFCLSVLVFQFCCNILQTEEPIHRHFLQVLYSFISYHNDVFCSNLYSFLD